MVLAIAAAWSFGAAACGSGAEPSTTVVDLGRPEAVTAREAPAAQASGSASARGDGIAWSTSVAEARARAERSHRPLLVFVWAAWDISSRALERDQLADPRVVTASRGAVALRVDATNTDVVDEPGVASLHIKSAPTVIVLAPNGRELYRSEASRIDVDALLDALGAP